MRYFIELCFDGTAYHGWQVQPEQNSVQGEINNALETLLQKEVMVTGAGRTDAGVHARQMYAHFDAEVYDPGNLKNKLNGILPSDIAIKEVFPVKRQAHARFDAISRSYRYYVHTEKDPFCNDYSWFVPQKPDPNEMNKAAFLLTEYSDFTSFSKVNTETKTNLCTITTAKWQEQGNKQLVFSITADRFLRNMVRAIVGTLIDVGQGKISIRDFKKIIEAEDRSLAGVSAPAKGLFLNRVKYPEEIFRADK